MDAIYDWWDQHAMQLERETCIYRSWLYQDESAKWLWIPTHKISKLDVYWCKSNEMDGKPITTFVIITCGAEKKYDTTKRNTSLLFGPSHYSDHTRKPQGYNKSGSWRITLDTEPDGCNRQVCKMATATIRIGSRRIIPSKDNKSNSMRTILTGDYQDRPDSVRIRNIRNDCKYRG